MYDPKSSKAEDFINDEEIRATLAYAEENKNNLALIDEILEKARPIREGNTCRCHKYCHYHSSCLLQTRNPVQTIPSGRCKKQQ